MLHGAGICTPAFTRTKSPSHVGVHIPTPWFAYIWGSQLYNTILVGGIPTPLKNDGVRQLGLFFPIPFGYFI